ncbi:MAG: Trm112 family protein [Planctomycetota bacterium]
MTTDTPKLDDKLLAILVCPLTRSALTQEGDWLVAHQPEGAGLRYPIKDGIPVLLMDQATLPEGVATLDDFKAKYADCIPA